MLQGSLVRVLPWTPNFFELSLYLLLCNPQMTLCYCRVGTRGTQPTRFTIYKETLGNCFDIRLLCRTYPKCNCLNKLNLILLWSYLIYVVRMVTCCIRSILRVIFQVRVVLTWTVVVVDWHFDNLSGGHLTWLWRLLPLRFSKHQLTTTTRVLLRTTFTRKITLKQVMWVLGSNHS